jgi:signal transduction histidine kinase
MSGRFARLGLRSRLMAVGLAGVAGALVVGGLLLYAAMSAALDRATVQEARASAQDVASMVDAGRLPDPVPVSGALVVQVLDERNRVVGGSATADRLTALVTPVEAERLASGGTFVTAGNRAGLSGQLRLVGIEAGPDGGRVLVVAGVPTADLETSRQTLRRLMLVFFPAFLAVLAVIAWWVIGRTLRPVEQLRQGAARIGESADPGERLPVLPARDEVSALATTLNDMLGRLHSANVAQRAFVADAAHELRSPLATMRTQLEVADRLGEGGELARELLPEVGRLSALVEDLLVLARSGSEAGPPARERVDVAEVLAALQARYGAARVPVRVHGPSGGADIEAADTEAAGTKAAGTKAADTDRVAADPSAGVLASRDDLVRALGNLVDNAVRHARTGVVLDWEAEADGILLTVADDGSGIPAADRERVFDRFTRLDDARDRDSGGIGLGLPITRALLRRNGGRVWLEDARPGVRAIVTLPFAEASVDGG